MSVSRRYSVGIASVRVSRLFEFVNSKRLAEFPRRIPEANFQLVPKPVNSDEVARHRMPVPRAGDLLRWSAEDAADVL